MFAVPHRLLASFCALGFATLPILAFAQDASPLPELGPPSAAECQIAPRSSDEIATLQAAMSTPISGEEAVADADPIALPDGDPVDDAIRTAITQTVREVIACADAGDVARLLALYSDRAAQQFVLADEPVVIVPGQSPVNGPDVSASPVANADRTPVIGEAVVMPDGRVAALVSSIAPGSRTEVVIFVDSAAGDRWLIDEIHPLFAGDTSETPATPETPGAEIDNQVVLAVIADAAKRLGLPFTDVSVILIEAKEFSDSSLGCPKEDEFYAQVITPGFQITVKGMGQELDYRADTNGYFFLCEG